MLCVCYQNRRQGNTWAWFAKWCPQTGASISAPQPAPLPTPVIGNPMKLETCFSPWPLPNQAGFPKMGGLLVFTPHGPGRPKGPYLHSVQGCKGRTRCLSSSLFINEMSVLIQTLCVYTTERAGGGCAHLGSIPGQVLSGAHRSPLSRGALWKFITFSYLFPHL